MCRDIKSVLMRHSWFASLPADLAAQIIRDSVRRDVAAGALVYGAGDASNGQFAVLSGEVRLVANTASGKHILYRVLKPGGWFGHLGVLDREPRFQDAVAGMASSLLFLPIGKFNSIINENPRAMIHFSRLVCQDIRVAMSMLADMKTVSLPARLAHALLQSSEAIVGEDARLTQEALAAMLGTSRQTVNKALRRLEATGHIGIAYGRITVRNANGLSELAGEDPTGMRPERQLSTQALFA